MNKANKKEIAKEYQDLDKILQTESPFHIYQIYGFVLCKNIELSHQAAKKICSILNKDYGKTPWSRLNESYRHIFLPNRAQITNIDLNQIMNNFSEKEAAHLIGIASMNASGYLREDALKILGRLLTPEIIPYLLLRLNDWVPTVSSAALEIFQSKLRQFHPIDLIKNFILVERFEKSGYRNNLQKIKSKVYSHLISPEFREEVFLYLDKGTVKENLFYWKLLSEEILQNQELINMALTSKHPEIRKWVVYYITKDDLNSIYLDKLLKDKSLLVRYTALRSIPELLRQKYKDLFQAGLFDSAKKIREYSRFLLGQLSPQDFREIYQKKLNGSNSSVSTGALLGWLEVSRKEDEEEVVRLLKSPIRKIREAAFQTLARLRFTKTTEYYLAGMVDSNAKVRRICTQVLKKTADQVQTKILQLLTNQSLDVKEAALNVLSSQGPSRALNSILYALNLPDESLANIAWKYLDKWYENNAARPYFFRDIQVYNEIIHLYETVGKNPTKKQNLCKWWNALPQLFRFLKPD